MIPIRPGSRPYLTGIAFYFGYIAMLALALGAGAALVSISLALVHDLGLTKERELYLWPDALLRFEGVAFLYIPVVEWKRHWALLSRAAPISLAMMASCLLRGQLSYVVVAGSTTAAYCFGVAHGGGEYWYLLYQFVTYLVVMNAMRLVLAYEPVAPSRGAAIVGMQAANKHYSVEGKHNPWT